MSTLDEALAKLRKRSHRALMERGGCYTAGTEVDAIHINDAADILTECWPQLATGERERLAAWAEDQAALIDAVNYHKEHVGVAQTANLRAIAALLREGYRNDPGQVALTEIYATRLVEVTAERDKLLLRSSPPVAEPAPDPWYTEAQYNAERADADALAEEAGGVLMFSPGPTLLRRFGEAGLIKDYEEQARAWENALVLLRAALAAHDKRVSERGR